MFIANPGHLFQMRAAVSDINLTTTAGIQQRRSRQLNPIRLKKTNSAAATEKQIYQSTEGSLRSVKSTVIFA